MEATQSLKDALCIGAGGWLNWRTVMSGLERLMLQGRNRLSAGAGRRPLSWPSSLMIISELGWALSVGPGCPRPIAWGSLHSAQSVDSCRVPRHTLLQSAKMPKAVFSSSASSALQKGTPHHLSPQVSPLPLLSYRQTRPHIAPMQFGGHRCLSISFLFPHPSAFFSLNSQLRFSHPPSWILSSVLLTHLASTTNPVFSSCTFLSFWITVEPSCIPLPTKVCSQSYGFSSSHVWMWELDHKESWEVKNWWFWTVVLENTLESPLDSKESIQPVYPKGNQHWIFTARTDAEAEAPIVWPPDGKNWLLGKDPDAGKDWRQEEKGMMEEMVG